MREDDSLDALVIGGGQAGLAMGYELAQRGFSFLILDANPEIGHAWRSRWESLRLFTATQFNGLPGMGFPGPRDTYPGKDAVADFLEAYATAFELPVRLDATVESLLKRGDTYLATTNDGVFAARNLVVATGPFQVPFTPQVADGLASGVRQLHSARYRDPESLPAGKILVVGGANSGCQIALELADTHTVELSVGQRLPTLPQRPLGRDIWWWLTASGLSRVTVQSRLGQRLSTRDVVIGGGQRELRRHGVEIRSRVVSAAGRTITFSDGASSDYDAVVWATGFRTDHSWIDVPAAKDDEGRIVHQRGVTASAGLYMLGLTWQHTRTSALLGWVGEDAAFLADQIARRADATRGPGREELNDTTPAGKV